MAKKTPNPKAKPAGEKYMGKKQAGKTSIVTLDDDDPVITAVIQEYIPVAGGNGEYVYLVGERFTGGVLELLPFNNLPLGKIEVQGVDDAQHAWMVVKIAAGIPAGSDKEVKIKTENGEDTNDKTNPAEQFKTA